MEDQDVRAINDLFDVIGDKLLKSTEIVLHSYGNLTLAEANAVYAIGSGEPKTMKQIAEALGVAVSTPTRTVDRLVEKNIAKRTLDPDDRRKILIELTASGEEVLLKMDREGLHMIRKMLEPLHEKEIDNLKVILKKIAENI